MKSVHIRDVPPETLAALKRLAKQHHRSLQGELQAILEDAARRAGPEAGRKLRLNWAQTEGVGTWNREEIYGADGR